MRCFIAIDLSEDIKAEIGRQQAAIRAALAQAPSRDREINWTRPEGIHLTLKFLGETDRVDQVIEALQGIGPFEKFFVEVKGFGFFPDARRPRVLWTGIEAPPALAELAGQVETALERLGFAPEHRGFKPHLTLARFQSRRPETRLRQLPYIMRHQNQLSLGRFEVSEFFLFESKLSPRGAEYRKVARFGT
ncbi:MAG: RNA 2',3'-cyclic phosphodiesterase [Acidobacteria bacterium]|nr:MAG: RNA 2',3'-cyclic phosphodiesterase [Acidobacteriota bacterium]